MNYPVALLGGSSFQGEGKHGKIKQKVIFIGLKLCGSGIPPTISGDNCFK